MARADAARDRLGRWLATREDVAGVVLTGPAGVAWAKAPSGESAARAKAPANIEKRSRPMIVTPVPYNVSCQHPRLRILSA